MKCLAVWENFLHDNPTPLLIKTALVQIQIETIHPFLDGNGRVGRLLIALLLHSTGELCEPLLFLSLYFKQHRNRFYREVLHLHVMGEHYPDFDQKSFWVGSRTATSWRMRIGERPHPN